MYKEIHEDAEEEDRGDSERLEDLETERMEVSLLERSKGKDRAVQQRGR